MRARESESKGADPVRVFLILAAILVAIGVVFWLTRSDPIANTPANATSPTGSPDFSLTNEEAIARFKELDALKVEMYRTQDRSLFDSVFTDDSPSRAIVEKDLDKLSENSIRFESTYQTSDISIQSNQSQEIRLRQSVAVTPRLVNAQGENVSNSKTQHHVVLWVLRPESHEWLVYKTVVVSAK